jgi:hypothetical protein
LFGNRIRAWRDKMEFTPNGEEKIKESKPAIVVYAISLIGKVPYIVRDEYEKVALMEQLKDIGYKVISMDIEVPLQFRGWHFPRPLKPAEPSLN